MCPEAELLEKASLHSWEQHPVLSGEGCSEVGDDLLQSFSRCYLQVCFQQVLSLPKELETARPVWLSG